MAALKCPQCGYVFQPFETECPKCKIPAPTSAPKPAAPVAPRPPSQPISTAPVAVPPRAPAKSTEGTPKPPAGDDSKQQICESCKGKYSVDLAICPYCRHKSTLERHTTGVRFSLEQERTIIGSIGGGLLVAACLLAFWVFKYQGEEIEYRVLGLKDFQMTVETKVLRSDGKGLRSAGLTTYWYKPNHLRVDLSATEDPVGRPITRLARLGDGEMFTVDPAAGVAFTQSYSTEAFQAPVIEPVAAANPDMVTAPAVWQPFSNAQPIFSLLGNFDPSGKTPYAQLVQSPVKTPTPPSGPARKYKLENLGRESINGFSTTHYRLTTSIMAEGCSGLVNGQEVTDYWVVPNLNGRFFEVEPQEAKTSGASSKENWEDERASATPTPDPAATPEPTPTPLPVAGTPAPKEAPKPLPIPTPYSPATRIAGLRPSLAVEPTPSDACGVENLRNGEETDFQNLFKGLILKIRFYKGKTVVMEQEVKRFKRTQLNDSDFSANQYPMVNASEFWAKRAAPLPKATSTPKPELKVSEKPQVTATPSGGPPVAVKPTASAEEEKPQQEEEVTRP